MTLHSVILHRFHTGSGALPASYPFGIGSDAAGTRRWPVTQFHLHRDQECVEVYLHAPSAFIARCLIQKQGLSYYAYHHQIVKYNTGHGRSWDRLIPDSSRIPQCPNGLAPSELTPKWKKSGGPWPWKIIFLARLFVPQSVRDILNQPMDVTKRLLTHLQK